MSRLSPLRRPKASDLHYSWYHVDANRDGCGDDGGGVDIPVTETNCVFAPSLPPGKQQPVLITARARISLRLLSFVICSHALPSYPTFLGTPHNKRNKEQRIRISTYQKSYIVKYTVSDRLKFLFSILCSLFFLLRGAPYSSWLNVSNETASPVF